MSDQVYIVYVVYSKLNGHPVRVFSLEKDAREYCDDRDPLMMDLFIEPCDIEFVW